MTAKSSGFIVLTLSPPPHNNPGGRILKSFKIRSLKNAVTTQKSYLNTQ